MSTRLQHSVESHMDEKKVTFRAEGLRDYIEHTRSDQRTITPRLLNCEHPRGPLDVLNRRRIFLSR